MYRYRLRLVMVFVLVTAMVPTQQHNRKILSSAAPDTPTA